MTERANGWLKFFAALVPFAAAFLVGWGALNAKVSTLSERVDGKASKETVNVQYEAILRAVESVDARLARIEAGR